MRVLLASVGLIALLICYYLAYRLGEGSRQEVSKPAVQSAIAQRSTKKLDAMPPPRFVPVHTYPDGTVLMADPALLPDNKLPALNTKEAWEVKGGDYPAPQDMRRDR